MQQIKIHIIDDHQIVLDGLIAILDLESNFTIVESSLNGKNILKKTQQNSADILILDINMPEVDGIDILKEFKEKKNSCKTIVLSSYEDTNLIKEVLKLGANGYLSKQCASENIVKAINSVYNGEYYFSDTIKEKIVAKFKTDSDNSLTKRELEIMKLIIQEHTTKEISKQLTISVNTVETHRKNLMKKLNIKTTIGLAKYAIENKLT